MRKNDVSYCGECESDGISEIDGSYTCLDCGREYGRAFKSFFPSTSSKEEKEKKAQHERESFYGSATFIGRKVKDLKNLTAQKKEQAFRFHYRQKIFGRKRKNNTKLIDVLNISKRISSYLGVEFSTISDNFLYLYQKLENKGISFRGNSKEGFSAALITAVCREKGRYVTFKETASFFDDYTSKKTIVRNMRNAWRKLKRENIVDESRFNATINSKIFEYGGRLGMDYTAQVKASKIFDFVKRKGYTSGKDEVAMIAGILHYASERTPPTVSKKAISEISRVQTSTIRYNSDFIKTLKERRRKQNLLDKDSLKQ